MSVPLEWQSTTRLSLRPPTPADAPAVLRILSDESVVKYNPADRVEDLSDVEALLGRWLEHWSQHDLGNCCVFEKDTGQLIGSCGVRRNDRSCCAGAQPHVPLSSKRVGSGLRHGSSAGGTGLDVPEPARPDRARQGSSQKRG